MALSTHQKATVVLLHVKMHPTHTGYQQVTRMAVTSLERRYAFGFFFHSTDRTLPIADMFF